MATARPAVSQVEEIVEGCSLAHQLPIKGKDSSNDRLDNLHINDNVNLNYNEDFKVQCELGQNSEFAYDSSIIKRNINLSLSDEQLEKTSSPNNIESTPLTLTEQSGNVTNIYHTDQEQELLHSELVINSDYKEAIKTGYFGCAEVTPHIENNCNQLIPADNDIVENSCCLNNENSLIEFDPISSEISNRPSEDNLHNFNTESIVFLDNFDSKLSPDVSIVSDQLKDIGLGENDLNVTFLEFTFENDKPLKPPPQNLGKKFRRRGGKQSKKQKYLQNDGQKIDSCDNNYSNTLLNSGTNESIDSCHINPDLLAIRNPLNPDIICEDSSAIKIVETSELCAKLEVDTIIESSLLEENIECAELTKEAKELLQPIIIACENNSVQNFNSAIPIISDFENRENLATKFKVDCEKQILQSHSIVNENLEKIVADYDTSIEINSINTEDIFQSILTRENIFANENIEKELLSANDTNIICESNSGKQFSIESNIEGKKDYSTSTSCFGIEEFEKLGNEANRLAEELISCSEPIVLANKSTMEDGDISINKTSTINDTFKNLNIDFAFESTTSYKKESRHNDKIVTLKNSKKNENVLQLQVNQSEAGPEIATGLTSSDLKCASQFFKEAAELESQIRKNIAASSFNSLSDYASESSDSDPYFKQGMHPPNEERSAPEGTSSPDPRTHEDSEDQNRLHDSVDSEHVNELLKKQAMEFEEKLLRQGIVAAEKEKQLHEAMKGERGRLQKVTASRDALLKLVEQYKGMLAALVADKNKQSNTDDVAITSLEKEKQQAIEDLANVEAAFSDVHRKYERTKQIVDTLKRNEETLRNAVADYEDKLQKQENKFNELQRHAEEKVKEANEEFDSLRRSNEQEMIKMGALLKKAEMKIISLQEALDRKTRENQELTQLCDDLISKVGTS